MEETNGRLDTIRIYSFNDCLNLWLNVNLKCVCSFTFNKDPICKQQ